MARNWRCRDGEIDLVVRRGGVLAFCEVKTRTSERYGLPSEAVGAVKQRRLRRLAVRWLADLAGSGPSPTTIRFDVVSILGGDLEVVQGAF